MGNRRIKLQLWMIYGIIITAFLGSALFFSYLNTGAMMTAVEKETDLGASILTADIHTKFPPADGRMEAARYELVKELDERLNRALDDVGVVIDVWAVDAAGKVIYTRSGGFPREEWEATDLGALAPYVSELRWIGDKSPFWLNQSLFLVRQIGDTGLYLVALNHCSAIRALQRSQFALFVGIELVLILTMIVLLTNTISTYRRLLIQLATTDELTGLANRKSFLAAFDEFTKRREWEEFSMFLVDIDFFKKINDTYGHATGDAALKLLSANIRRMVERHNGFAGRWGGDEFIGVLPLPVEAARDALSEMCGAVREAPVEGDVHITISAGVAVGAADTPLARLSEMADRALYCSKARGRNQASLFDGSEAQPETVAASPAFAGTASEKPQAAAPAPVSGEEALSLGARLRRYFREHVIPSTLLGVHWMAPFVAGGGLLIGLAFLFDAASVNLAALSVAERAGFGSITRVAAILKSIGDSTFNFMLPVFAGFMAYGLAGESAFMAGFVGGFMTIDTHSGFIGAMVAGFAAGMIAGQMQRFMDHMPALIRKAAPIVVYPVFNLLLMQGISWLVISPISNWIGTIFTGLLDSAVTRNSALAGALAGGMMAIDMGGIVNKVAYNYGVSGLAEGNTALMASVMAGGMIPPLGIVMSMFLFRHKFTREERDRSVGTAFMGLSFITEGALPFVFSDALRVIPACVAGSAAAGLVSSAFNCALPAPHGGVFVIPVMDHPVSFLVALLAGTLLTALLLALLKKEVTED